jgi:cobalt/nickel transport system permease protein
VWATLDLITIPAVSILAKKARAEVDDLRIPMLGVMGAFVFAAQMINFPVGMGTSGHLVGGALLATTLGPAAATLVMTAILAVQALVFQDGGILALGPNVLNMAFAGVLAGYLPIHYFGTRWRRGAIFVGGFLSVLVSAILALTELLLSGMRIAGAVLWVSLGLFAIAALLEGLITVAAVEAIERLHPSWVRRTTAARSPALAAIALAAVFLACVGVTFASAAPDGLEKLAEMTGISERARVLIETPLADYELVGTAAPWAGKAIAGIAGLAVIFGLCVTVARALRTRDSTETGGEGA